jgi:hypothetical protein
MGELPPEVEELLRARSAARAARDFARADAIRDELLARGWRVVDERGGGSRLEPARPPAPARRRASEVPSVLGEPATAEATFVWVVPGWPEDVERGLAAVRASTPGRAVHLLVVDLTEDDPARWAPDVEVVALDPGTGWAAAANVGLRRARGRVVVLLDGSVEPTGEVLGPIEAALADPGVGLVGPFGLLTRDLRSFEEVTRAGPVDAVQAYLIACRRELLAQVGGFDEGFRWYRTADIEWSFRVKDAGLATAVVPLPVTRHEHRMWASTPPTERDRRSKRNFYRFLDRWRDRWDLIVAGPPTADG